MAKIGKKMAILVVSILIFPYFLYIALDLARYNQETVDVVAHSHLLLQQFLLDIKNLHSLQIGSISIISLVSPSMEVTAESW